jgi:hypothetical protein
MNPPDGLHTGKRILLYKNRRGQTISSFFTPLGLLWAGLLSMIARLLPPWPAHPFCNPYWSECINDVHLAHRV